MLPFRHWCDDPYNLNPHLSNVSVNASDIPGGKLAENLLLGVFASTVQKFESES
jgi:hypothetical protein